MRSDFRISSAKCLIQGANVEDKLEAVQFERCIEEFIFDFDNWFRLNFTIANYENVNNVKFSLYSTPDILNVEYCGWITSGKNNFGCMNLKRKSYCILNKQYYNQR